MKERIQAILMILAFYFFGSLSMYEGLKNYNNKEYDGYIKVVGTFKEVKPSLYGSSFNLVYQYKVNNVTYTITSDYSSEAVPISGTSKTIYYNPNNPSIATLDNTKINVFNIVMGAIFIIFPTAVLAFISLTLSGKSLNNPYKNGIVVGLIFIFLGMFSYYMMSIGGDSISLTSVFDAVGLWILIPFVFIISGLYTSITGLININNNPNNI